MNSVMNDHVALRLGLAAKALPQLNLKVFIDQLINVLGEPLTEKKLRSLNPKQLFQLLTVIERDIERSQVNQAFAILTSAEISSMQTPEVHNAMPLLGPKLRVAVSSNNLEQLDGHFGSCLRFLIYEVNGTELTLVEVRPVSTYENGLSRTDYLVDLIKDCHVLSTLSIGGPAAAKVVRSDILPIKQANPSAIADSLMPLTHVIRNNPPRWMTKVFEKQESVNDT